MGEFFLIFKIEGRPFRRSLPLLRKSFQHSLLNAHRGVVFTKTPINNATSSILLFVFFQERFLTLQELK